MIKKKHTVIDTRWWFVCYIMPGHEMEFRRKLAKAAIINFAPVTSDRIKLDGKIIRRMLFPGYVFVFGSQYSKFKKEKTIKNFLYVINSENEKIYHLPHQIVFELILKQALGVFDYKKNQDSEKINVGDNVFVDSVSDKPGVVVEVTRKEASILLANKVWKIKLSLLRKSA